MLEWLFDIFSSSSSNDNFPYLTNDAFPNICSFLFFEDCGLINMNQGANCVSRLAGRHDSVVYLWVADGWDINDFSKPLSSNYYTWTKKRSPAAIDRRILYLGKAEDIHQRFRGYGSPGPSQSTNKKMHSVAVSITKTAPIRIYFHETLNYREAGEIEKYLLSNVLTFFNEQDNLW